MIGIAPHGWQRKKIMMPTGQGRANPRSCASLGAGAVGTSDSNVVPAVSVVVPTFREAPNIQRLIERVHASLSGSDLDWELIVVDDDSGDGIDLAVSEIACSLPVRIEVRRTPPRDLSLSVLRGFRLARSDTLVVLDADLSHPPERIPDLLAALGPDCEMVIGSRYAAGGVLERSWSLRSFLNSRIATVLALPLVSCSDPMSGFFAVRRSALPDPGSLRPIGYKIGLELMVRGQLRVNEVPIGFTDRIAGSSKTNWRQQVNFLRQLSRLYSFRRGGLFRAFCFGLIGASGMAVDLSCYIVLQLTGLDHRMARFLSFWPAVTWNWFLNRGTTYKGRPIQPRMQQWARFVVTSLAGLAANVGTYAALTSFVDVFDDNRLAAFLLGIGVGSVLNFLGAELYVYREHRAPRESSGKRAWR